MRRLLLGLAAALPLWAAQARAVESAAEARAASAVPAAHAPSAAPTAGLVPAALPPEVAAPPLSPAAQAEAGAAEAAAVSRAARPASLPAAAAGVETAAGPAAAGEGAASSSSDEPLLLRARAEAAKLGVSAVDDAPALRDGLSALAPLRTRGFAFLPGAAFLTEADRAALEAEFEAAKERLVRGEGSFEIFKNYRKGGWVQGRRSAAPGRAAVERLTELLRAALPGEDLVLNEAEGRVGYRANDAVHVDAQYATMTIALRGPGTLVYKIDGAEVAALEAPADVAAVMTNLDRQRAEGIAATVHSSPTPDRYASPEEAAERRLLVVRWRRRGQPEADPREAAANAALVKARIERVQRSPAGSRLGSPAGRRGLMRSLRAFFE